MVKPEFQSWANIFTLWYEHCPGAKEAQYDALRNNDLQAMNTIIELAAPIIAEIGEVSVKIVELESRKEVLSKLYKDLEKQFNEYSTAYDNR